MVPLGEFIAWEGDLPEPSLEDMVDMEGTDAKEGGKQSDGKPSLNGQPSLWPYI